MSHTMYNAHRGMPAGAPNNRLNELLDQVRAEFENQQNRSGEAEQQITTQLAEMEMVRNKIFALEQQHHQIKQRYDEEIARLRHELEARGGPGQPSGGPAGAPHHPPPPNIGNGAGSSLFGTIIQPGGGQSGAGLVPPSQDHPSQQQGHALPPSQPGPPPASQPMYGGYAPNGYPSQPQPNSPRSRPRGPTGPATPQQQQQPQPGYPADRSPHAMTRPTPPPTHRMPNNVGNQLADLNPELLSPHQKRDGDQWYAVFNPNVPRVLDVELMHTLQHESVVCCVRFSADGAYVATGCNRCAQIYEVSSGRQITVLQDDSVEKDGDLYIRSVCFSPDGRLLATGAEDKQIRVWDIQSKTIRQTFSGHEQDIYSLDFSRDGRHIASGSGDRSVRVWDIESGMEVLQLQIEDGVTTVAMSPDGTYVAAGSLDKSVRVWDTRNGNLVERLDGPDGHKDSVYSVAFAPSGRELVSGSLDKTIKMWELNGSADRRGLGGHGPRGGRCIRTFEGHKDFVLSVALTPDGAWVMSGSKDRGVQFWDPATGQAQLMLQGHKNSVISVAPSPVGPCFATGSGDMRARIWRYKPWRQ